MPHPIRRGRVNLLWILLLGAVGLLAFLVIVVKRGTTEPNDGKQVLVIHCAAGLRIPVEEIAEAYEKEYGVRVDIQPNGSNTILTQLQVNKFGEADLYLAADDFYTDEAVRLGLAVETLPIALQRPVIAVPKDSDLIHTLEDLLKPGVRIAAGNPEHAAVGRAIQQRLEKIEIDGTNRWTQLEARIREDGVFKPTVTDIATDVKMGSVDAALVWDSTVMMPKFREDLKAIYIPELDASPNLISVAILKSSTDPASALRFARFVTARDRGLKTFQKYGTRPVEGDVWAEKPEISFYCGAINRRVVEELLDDFQKREGVVINTQYNGCGILTSQMMGITDQSQALGFPDVYMACDRYYLDNVRDWFQEDVDVSDVELVIAVPKGSSKVSSLSDLVKPGIRVAIGEPEQCTIGALTKRVLDAEGLYEKLKEKQLASGEVVVEKSSSSLLVPDVITGHVDATIAYISDVLPNTKDVDIIRIQSADNIAIQPFSIARTSDHKYLARRLYQKISESPKAFEAAGFHFRLPAGEGSDSEEQGAEDKVSEDKVSEDKVSEDKVSEDKVSEDAASEGTAK
jgi:molybdate transport system substrate-binding protein